MKKVIKKQAIYFATLTGFDAIGSMKFSLEHQNPLVTGEVSGDKSASKQNEYSLLTVSDPNVLLWIVKPSEEGMDNGLITRLWNMGSSKSNPEIKFSHNIGSAWKTTHIETNEKQLNLVNGRLSVSFNPYQIQSFRLLPKTK